MSQIPGIIADLSSQLFSAVHRIEIDLEQVRRRSEPEGVVSRDDARFLCEVQRKIVDLNRRERSL